MGLSLGPGRGWRAGFGVVLPGESPTVPGPAWGAGLSARVGARGQRKAYTAVTLTWTSWLPAWIGTGAAPAVFMLS